MPEPTIAGTAYGLGKWSLAGVSAGVTYAVAAVETNPTEALAMTPDLNTSLAALAVAVVGYVVKAYVPSKKEADSQYSDLKSGHTTLLEKLEAFAYDSNSFRTDLSRWMGGVDSKLERFNDQISRLEINADRDRK